MRNIVWLALLVSACGGGGSSAPATADADRDPIFNMSWEEYSARQVGTPRYTEGKVDPIRISYFWRHPMKGATGNSLERYVVLQSKGYTARHGDENPEPFARCFDPMVGAYVPDEALRKLADELVKLGVRDLPDFDLSKVETGALQDGRFKDTVITIVTPEFRKTAVIRNDAKATLRYAQTIDTYAYQYAIKVVTQVDKVIPNR